MEIINSNQTTFEKINSHALQNWTYPELQEAQQRPSSLTVANGAGERRMRAETLPQSNILNIKNVNGNEDLIDALMNYGNHPQNWNPLNCALDANDYKAALALLNYLGETSDVKNGVWFPLDRLLQKIHGSISSEQEQLLKTMTLKNFQNASGLISKSYTFSVVANYGEIGFVDWLLSQGVDLNDHAGYPFLGAVSSGRKSLVEYLLLKGADLSIAQGVLNTAVSSGSLELVKFLCEQKGQRPYAPWGNPLGVAISQKNFDILAYLLQIGVSPNEYQKVLSLALGLSEATPQEKEYKKSVVALLLKYGAKT